MGALSYRTLMLLNDILSFGFGESWWPAKLTDLKRVLSTCHRVLDLTWRWAMSDYLVVEGVLKLA